MVESRACTSIFPHTRMTPSKQRESTFLCSTIRAYAEVIAISGMLTSSMNLQKTRQLSASYGECWINLSARLPQGVHSEKIDVATLS